MKFYLFKYKAANSYKYTSAYICDNSPWKNENLFAGEYKTKHSLPIPYYVENKIKPTDFVFAKNILVSKSFYNLIAGINKDYEALESQIYYQGKNKKSVTDTNGSEIIWGIFYTMLFPDYGLLNEEASKCEYLYIESLKRNIIRSIDNLVLSSKKISQITFENNVFLLQEKKTYLLCTETAKQAIEEASLTGIDFEEVPVE